MSFVKFYFAKNQKYQIAFYLLLCIFIFLINIFFIKTYAFADDELDFRDVHSDTCRDEDNKYGFSSSSLPIFSSSSSHNNKPSPSFNQKGIIPKAKRLLICLIPKQFELDNDSINDEKEKKITLWEYFFGSKQAKADNKNELREICLLQNPDNKKIKIIALEQATQKQLDYYKAKQEKLSRKTLDMYRKELKMPSDVEFVFVPIDKLLDKERECLRNICNNDRYSKEIQENECRNVCPEIKTKVCEINLCNISNATFNEKFNECVKNFRKDDCIKEKDIEEARSLLIKDAKEELKRNPTLCQPQKK